jgi:hypothetical protein
MTTGVFWPIGSGVITAPVVEVSVSVGGSTVAEDIAGTTDIVGCAPGLHAPSNSAIKRILTITVLDCFICSWLSLTGSFGWLIARIFYRFIARIFYRFIARIVHWLVTGVVFWFIAGNAISKYRFEAFLILAGRLDGVLDGFLRFGGNLIEQAG